MKKTFYLMFLLLLTNIFPSSVVASDQIKSDTFQRFTKVAGLEKQYNQMITIFATNFQQGMVAGFEDGLKGKNIPEIKKKKLRQLVNETSSNFKNIFEEMFIKEIKWGDLVNNVYLPVYRKRFSESELKQIINFYSSPVGRKVAELTPKVMQESSDAFNKLYGGKVQALGGDLMNEEIDKLYVKVKELNIE